MYSMSLQHMFSLSAAPDTIFDLSGSLEGYIPGLHVQMK